MFETAKIFYKTATIELNVNDLHCYNSSENLVKDQKTYSDIASEKS